MTENNIMLSIIAGSVYGGFYSVTNEQNYRTEFTHGNLILRINKTHGILTMYTKVI